MGGVRNHTHFLTVPEGRKNRLWYGTTDSRRTPFDTPAPHAILAVGAGGRASLTSRKCAPWYRTTEAFRGLPEARTGASGAQSGTRSSGTEAGSPAAVRR